MSACEDMEGSCVALLFCVAFISLKWHGECLLILFYMHVHTYVRMHYCSGYDSQKEVL